MELGFKRSCVGRFVMWGLMLCVDLGAVFGKDVDFTFLLPAGGTECFFQTTVRNNSMSVEYQVIAGSGLDVGFTLISPSGYRLVSNFRKFEGTHMLESTEEGDYRICFDNSFSRLVGKMVYVVVTVDTQDGAAEEDDVWSNVVEPENTLGYKLENIREVTEVIHSNLERSHQVQATLRVLEARDRHLLEDNLWRVSFWSSINLVVMLSVALVQVYTVRRFFHYNNRSWP